jgi:hypothetical protein
MSEKMPRLGEQHFDFRDSPEFSKYREERLQEVPPEDTTAAIFWSGDALQASMIRPDVETNNTYTVKVTMPNLDEPKETILESNKGVVSTKTVSFKMTSGGGGNENGKQYFAFYPGEKMETRIYFPEKWNNHFDTGISKKQGEFPQTMIFEVFNRSDDGKWKLASAITNIDTTRGASHHN